MNKVNIEFRDGIYEIDKDISMLSFYDSIKNNIKENPLVGSINNKIVSLNEKISKDCRINFYDINTPIGNKAYERGISFVFIKAVRDILNCDVKIEHSLDKGIYCEILHNFEVDEIIVEKVKIRMKEIIALSMPIDKILVSRLDAIEYYNKSKQYEKAKALKYISNTSVSLYKLDNILDYFYGEVPINTKYMTEFDIKLLKDNCVILLYPRLYKADENLKYEHHMKLFEEFRSYSKWGRSLNITTISDLNELSSKGKYNDIIRIAEVTQNNKLFNTVNDISEEIKVILITGPSSSGKTTISKKLAMFLESKGKEPFYISIDDYFINRKDTPIGEDGKPDYESINAIDKELFCKQMNSLLNNEEVCLPTYDFIKGEKEFSKICYKLSEKSILIIEGLHAFNEELTKGIPKKVKYNIYLSPLTVLNIDNHNRISTTDNRLIRRMVRDNMTRGYNVSKTLSSWQKVRAGEEKYVFPYQDMADVVFNTSLLYELSVLKTYAEPLLFSVEETDINYNEAQRLINMLRPILAIPSESIPQDSVLREFIGGSCFK